LSGDPPVPQAYSSDLHGLPEFLGSVQRVGLQVTQPGGAAHLRLGYPIFLAPSYRSRAKKRPVMNKVGTAAAV